MKAIGACVLTLAMGVHGAVGAYPAQELQERYHDPQCVALLADMPGKENFLAACKQSLTGKEKDSGGGATPHTDGSER